MLDISDNLLHRLAGENAFSAGRALAQSGAVQDWQANGSNVRATVHDGDVAFKTRIAHTANTLDGSCNCPASDGIDFCAHCVALSIVWRDWTDNRELAERGSDAERLRRYVNTLNPQQLADALIDILESDQERYQQWLLAADRALGTLDARQLRKRINQIFTPQLRIGAATTAVTDCARLLRDVADAITPAQLAELGAHTLQRIAAHEQWQTIADDAGADIDQLQTLLLKGFHASEWRIDVRSAFLIELIASGYSPLLPAIPDAFIEDMSVEEVDSVLHSMTAAWERALDETGHHETEAALRNGVLRLAQTIDDVGTQLAVLTATASSADDFARLARLSLELDHVDAAMHWLQQARAAIRDSDDRRSIAATAVDIALYQGDDEAAIEHQWSLFATTLKATDLHPLAKISEHDITHWHTRGEAEIRRQIDTATKQRGQAILYERLAQFYFDIGELDDAAAIAVTHALSSDLLAKILQQQHTPEFAIPMSMRLARQWVESGDNRGYRKAVDALVSVYRDLDDPVHLRRFNDSIETLRQQLNSKRNFIKWLDDALRSA